MGTAGIVLRLKVGRIDRFFTSGITIAEVHILRLKQCETNWQKKKHVLALGDNKTELKREDYEMQFCEI